MAAAENHSESISSARRPAVALAFFWALAVVFAASYLHNQLLGFRELSDLAILGADDGMRLQEARDLAAGQSWFDTHQYRYLPPEGTVMHWSRFVDAPLAAGLLTLTPLFGADLAERIVLTAWPTLLFAIYCALAFVTLRRSFGTRAALLAVIAAPSYLTLSSLFSAGQIDHHNVQIVLTLASVLCFAMSTSRPKAAIIGGAMSALSLAIGLETLLFVATIGVVYAVAFVIDGRQARAFLHFAGALAFGSLAAFAAETPPSLWLTPTCDTLSTPWFLLTFGAAATAVAATAIGARIETWPARLAPLAVGGGIVAGTFALVFPHCLAGPYGAVPDDVRQYWLELTGEAFSFNELLARYPVYAATVFGPTLVATVVAWVGAFRSTGEGRRLLFLAAVLLSLTVVLSAIQVRAIYVGCALIPIATGFALERAISAAVHRPAYMSRIAALVLACALLFELPWVLAMVLVMYAGSSAPIGKQTRAETPRCFEDIQALRDLPTGTILGPLDLGPRILFLTRHSIVAAGYHRNVEGIVAGVEAFAGSEDDLRKFVARDRADYVVVCLPWIDAYPEHYGAFIKGLARGAPAPDWLAPVPLPTQTLKLWRVER